MLRDSLDRAIDAVDLPALIADLYPSSGARAGHAGSIKAAWRDDKDASASLSFEGGRWVYHDFATGQGGNVFHFLTQAENRSPAQAADELKRRAGLGDNLRTPMRAVSATQAKPAPKPAKVYASPTDQQLEAIRGNLEPVKADSSAARDLERRGLPLADFSQVKRGDGKVKPGAVVITVRNHAGQVMNFKVRNPDPLGGAPRYVYLITGHGAPPDQQADNGGAVLIIEGELNAARARMAFESIGLTFTVQGVAGANGQPDLSRIAGREVFVYADGDAAGVKAARAWSESSLHAGAAVARVLQPLEGEQDFCDLTHDALEAWISEAIGSATPVTLEDELTNDATSGDALGWGKRQPLPERPGVSTMPPEMIPEPLRAWLDDAARLSCVPLEILAVNAVCAASGVIGAAVNIHARVTFYSTPNLWGAGVVLSGMMKTASLKAVTEPLRKLEQAAQQDASEAQDDHELEVSRAEAKHAALEKSYTTGKARKGETVATAEEVKEAKRELTRLEQSRSEERTYTTTNTTHEALGMLLKVNPKGVTVLRDELGPFIASMNREDMSEARGFFNAGWDGDVPYSYHRVTREKVRLERVCVAICGMIQPKLLDELMARMLSDPMQNDGFLQRFQVLVYPDAYPQWTPPEQQHAATPDALERAVRVFTALDQLEVREGESVKPRRLSFAAAAQPVFNEWHDEIEVRSRPGGALEADTAFKSWFMKTKSLCVNLAAIFHLIELAETRLAWGDQLEPISLDALNLALDWCDYLTTHAQKVYALELHPEAHAARVAAGLIGDGSIKTGMTLRDVKRGNRSTPPALLEAGLYELERLGWVRLEEVDTGGRPSEVVYLHPELVGVMR